MTHDTTATCTNCGAAHDGRVCWTCGHAQYTGTDTATNSEVRD